MQKQSNNEKRQQGITLVVLAITIIVILILSTVTINMAFGDNGLIRQSQVAKDMSVNSTIAEETEMNRIMESYTNVIEEDKKLGAGPYVDNVVTSAPELSDGMVPVKWNGSNWVKTTENDQDWYNYANKEWANIVLTPESGQNEGKDATGTVDVFNEDGTLNENSAYTMLVWIPRYAYRITSGWHSNQTGDIEVVFIDKNNMDKNGDTYNGTYEQAVDGVSSGGAMNNFVQHPAFTYGDNELDGIWVGKYESSNTNCNTDISTGQQTYTGSEVLTVRAGVTSWRNIASSNAFDTCLNMNNNPVYGLTSNDNVVDPHMMKNIEWGAVVYLSKSIYGKNDEEIWKNNNSNYITGQAGNDVADAQNTVTNNYNTENGMKASTTGNVTGVYDMSGGTWETVAAYVDLGENNDTVGQSLLEAEDKYVDVYVSSDSNEQQSNYENAYNNYGDAMYEISSLGSGNNSWFNDGSQYFYDTAQYMHRGGRMVSGTDSGPYFFGYARGRAGGTETFRLAMSVM